MPAAAPPSRVGSIVSWLVHLLILYLLVMPENYGGLIVPMDQGAGGPGPAGGGGGRSAARIEYIQYAPLPPPPTPVAKPAFVFVPPKIEVPPPQIEPLRMLETPPVPGATTGAAPDPNGGAGPGTGGGVGSGVGTGKGTSIGPGTGGGDQPNYPPTPTEMFIPPLPVPASVRGAKILAEFDVDERGKVLGMKFTETGDRSYNRRLAEVLKGFRFRPGTRPDGTPIRMKAQVSIELP
jgi:protein TonB